MAFLDINEYKYDLPQERIALYPLARRDESQLLVYRKGEITHSHFKNISHFLPEKSFLFLNDTRVIPARIQFQKETGAGIEVFLLTPVAPSAVLAETMQSTASCTWKCTIGNLKRWTPGTRLSKPIAEGMLQAELIDREEGLVRLQWNGKTSFAEVISQLGETPLPPYLKRKAETSDRERYQTIYSHYEGAVAAPTAGLHFTSEVFELLRKKEIGHDFLTLHVSAGTFQPVKVENAEEHTMHGEQIIVTTRNLDNLLVPGRQIIAVGTTSMRTLESIYWFGAHLLMNEKSAFRIGQNDPYPVVPPLHTSTGSGGTTPHHLPSTREALEAVRYYMTETQQQTIIGETSIFIKPGYTFKVCNGLITNFHQPASTLMLLVAAFVGNDWKKIYSEAMTNNYRFLSFGDSSLLLP
jgi:S-adenosylmethionine:tRNA ribosyltransferase-isomerase